MSVNGVPFVFDASGIDPAGQQFPLWPLGWKDAVVVETSFESPKDKPQHKMVVATIEGIAGDVAGMRQRIYFNVQNENPDAVRIGLQQLSALCHVTGFMQIQSTRDLHGRPFKVLSEHRENEYQGRKTVQNRFQQFQDASGFPPVLGRPAGAPQPQTQAQANPPPGYAAPPTTPVQPPPGYAQPGPPPGYQPQPPQTYQGQPTAPAGQPATAPQADPPAGWQQQPQPGAPQQPAGNPPWGPPQ